jgi:uncharacterized protein YegL
MVGTPIEQVQEGMRTIIQNLRVDPYALETVFVSIIAFAGKATSLSSLTELYKFYPPIFPIGGGTSLGAGLDFLMNDLDCSIQKTTVEVKGDWKPIIFLFTDGNPTDNFQYAFKRWNDNYRQHCNLVAISLGDNLNTSILAQITENVFLLKDTDEESFSKFFKWVTASIKTTSVSVTEQSSDEIKLAPTTGINLEKADLSGSYTADENFVVLHGRCQTTKQDYLVKYAKRLQSLGIERQDAVPTTGYKLVGAYPINRETYALLSLNSNQTVNTINLVGVPTCPCCGNQLGVVVCECGNIFCVGENNENECPWCGLKGSLGNIAPNGIDVSRSIG